MVTNQQDKDKPRLDGPQGLGNSANDRLLGRAIGHSIWLEKLKTGQVKDALGFLNDKVYPDVIAKITEKLLKIQDRGIGLNLEQLAQTVSTMVGQASRLSPAGRRDITTWRTLTGRQARRLSYRCIAIRRLMMQVALKAVDQLNKTVVWLKEIIDDGYTILRIKFADQLKEIALNQAVHEANVIRSVMFKGITLGQPSPQHVGSLRKCVSSRKWFLCEDFLCPV